ncbi:pyridoxal phosphate-dependent aminotransferase [Gracilibacillus caseinilyticus]|uniref:Pyridoxal phosphate-dependent aminotransferase n=1 Tax=Gracilibacillus caseinilyticus TaxID=2932256 RepID=A0ABY4F280_9BACI|nr:pyridoxal phosphate-dependent aminotransferase [Gracilibacillus caseinilyticus]UOQ48536.1 pyridoxal phosphate-dependent aminotransferase [Gracilibacillus caseinilyticus]
MINFEYSDALQRLPEQFFVKLVKTTQALVKQGHDVINLGQGNPDMPTPDFIVEALQKASTNPLYHKYSPFQGYPFLKQAIADFYQREYQVDVDPETEIAIMFGSKTGLVEINQCLLNPHDKVLVPDPGYPDYMSGVALSNAEAVHMPLREENEFLPDYEEIAEQDLEEAKLMFLNYPNNPTAATATKDFFDETIEMAEKYEICVVHDFAYGAIGFDEKPQSFLQSPGAKNVGVEMYTLSKTYNMAGWRVAFAVGNPSVISALELIHDHYYVSIFGAIQAATKAALDNGQESIRSLNRVYGERRDAFLEEAANIGWHGGSASGSFFVWMPVADGHSSESFAKLLLEKTHVVVAPGNGFGDEGEGYVRIGLLEKPERLREACKRIDKLGLF